MEQIKSRLRAKSLWVGTAAFVLILLQHFGVDIAPEKYDAFVNSVLGLLTLWGIIDGSQ